MKADGAAASDGANRETQGVETIWTEVSTVGDLLVRAARLHPERDAAIFPEARISYQALLEDALQFARGLAGLGIGAGDHVGLFLPNGLDYLRSFFGAALLGAVVVPLNVRHKSSELRYIIANADLAAVLTSDEMSDHANLPAELSAALPELCRSKGAGPLQLDAAPRLRHVVQLSGTCANGLVGRAAFDAAGQATPVEQVEAARRAVRIRDIAAILYTSGTTANPKGCMLSHEALTRGPVERGRTRLHTCDHEVVWAAGPLFHIGSFAPFIGCLGVAGTLLADRFFDPGRAVRLLAQGGVTVAWPWFPAIVQGLIDHPQFRPQDFPNLRRLFLIAPETLVARVQGLLPQTEVLQACGMTETAGVFAMSAEDEPPASRSRSQGKAVPGVDVRIVDPDTGADLPAGRMGEILVRGYCLMEGYYGDPQKTRATIADGWLRTGDLYVMTENGSLVFSGRLKDMLKVGGENVATMEVEAFLCSHPDVKLAEVVGKPDTRLDEVPIAFVELRPGATITPADLIAYCRGRIANYKLPRKIIFMSPEDWPMSATKIDKRALRARLQSHSGD